MGPETVTGLALIHVHYGMHVYFDQVVDAFGRKRPGKLGLLNNLNFTVRFKYDEHKVV